MSRTVAWLPTLLLLPGCVGRPADPFAPLRARLEVIERNRPAEAVSRETAVHPASSWHGSSSYLTLSDMGPGSLGRSSSGLSFALTEDTTAAPTTETSVTAGEERVFRQRTPLPGFGETVKRDLENLPQDLWEDTKAVYGSAPNLVILGVTYGGMLAVQETGPDDTVEDSYHHHTTFDKEARDTFGALGNPGTHFALAGVWYLIGQRTQNETTYEVGRTLFSALIINGLSTVLGQAATWDRAPNGEWGTFPSGHTSSTFAVASVMHEAYGPLVGVPLYGLGVLVAMERLEDGEHYLSDVLMGGVMGLVIGHSVAGQHEFKLFGGEVLPYADPYTGSSGVAWVKHFK